MADFQGKAQNKNQVIKSLSTLKFILILFFIFHYGVFMMGHLFFVYFVSFVPYIFTHNGHFPVSFGFSYEIFIIVTMLFFSHGFSFVKNFIFQKEYLKTSVTGLMASPYKRVILMHITLLFGGVLSVVLVLLLGSLSLGGFLEVVLSSVVICIFIILKTIVDVRAHSKQHASLN